MKTRSANVGESGGTGDFHTDDSSEEPFIGASDRNNTCDACPGCMDVCPLQGTYNFIYPMVKLFIECEKCQNKRAILPLTPPRPGSFSMCQVRRHRIRGDCWLVAHGKVYDASVFMKYHPAGSRPILSRGGSDCTKDYDFHSNVSHREYWKPLCIGKVIPCPVIDPHQPSACTIV